MYGIMSKSTQKQQQKLEVKLFNEEKYKLLSSVITVKKLQELLNTLEPTNLRWVDECYRNATLNNYKPLVAFLQKKYCCNKFTNFKYMALKGHWSPIKKYIISQKYFNPLFKNISKYLYGCAILQNNMDICNLIVKTNKHSSFCAFTCILNCYYGALKNDNELFVNAFNMIKKIGKIKSRKRELGIYQQIYDAMVYGNYNFVPHLDPINFSVKYFRLLAVDGSVIFKPYNLLTHAEDFGNEQLITYAKKLPKIWLNSELVRCTYIMGGYMAVYEEPKEEYDDDDFSQNIEW